MDITKSIVDNLATGSQAPPGSIEHKNWNRAYERLYRNCWNELLVYLSGSFPSLDSQDHQDILQETFHYFRRRFGKALGASAGLADDQERIAFAKRLPYTICRWRALTWKKVRTRIVSREGISLDAPISGDSDTPLGETIAACFDLLAILEEKEKEDAPGQLIAKKDGEILDPNVVLDALVATGKRSQESVEIFKAHLSGKKPVEIMEQLGISRSKVDNIKLELRKQLEQITQLRAGGLTLEDAIAASDTKPKKKAAPKNH